MSVEQATYVDSSAVVKLAVREPESDELRRFLRRRRRLVSSALARAEVVRAVLPLGESAVDRARVALAHIDLVRVSNRVLAAAGTLPPPESRTLVAIHLATASLLADSLSQFVCYDERLAESARSLGWTVRAPS